MWLRRRAQGLENQADALRCLSLADGKEIWRYSYPVKVKGKNTYPTGTFITTLRLPSALRISHKVSDRIS